jgi:hypothetical protein
MRYSGCDYGDFCLLSHDTVLSGRICLRFGETCCLQLQGRMLKQQVLQKYSGISVRSHSARPQMKVIFKIVQYICVHFGETTKLSQFEMKSTYSLTIHATSTGCQYLTSGH